jgi:6-phosphogluconolactonase
VTDVTVLADPGTVARAAADRVVSTLRSAIEERGAARVALSGGGTPKQVYPLLLEPARRDAVDWGRVEFFWGDERAVPPDHPESNFGVAYRSFISHLPGVQPGNVHRMPAEAQDIHAAALSHESEIRLAFGAHGSEVPSFDLVWLGMGPDGHTASLFPGSAALDENERWVVANWAPGPEAWRMTLTYPVLDAARQVLFVVTGADKAEAFARVRAGDRELPAARVGARSVEWLVDTAVAAATE